MCMSVHMKPLRTEDPFPVQDKSELADNQLTAEKFMHEPAHDFY